LVHELGHFWSARSVGIKVLSFGIGFGPKLFTWTGKDGVKYVIRLLPLGGYNRYFGEDSNEGDHKDAFHNQPVGKRAFSTFAGPFMNFVTAVVAFFLLFCAFGVPYSVPEIGSMTAGYPAQEAGLLVGDKFVSVNGEEVRDVEHVSIAIRQSADEPVELTIDRNGNLIDVVVVPRMDADLGYARIWITYAQEAQRYGAWDSVKLAFQNTWLSIAGTFDFLRGLVTRGEGVNDVAGPIGTLQVVVNETQSGGLRSYIGLLAMISISLGFFNMLPIPGLDGSRLLFLLVEKIRGKRIDPNKEGMIHLIGIGLLLLLMLPIYIRDIVRLF
jgi:regulator of sigma E protease